MDTNIDYNLLLRLQKGDKQAFEAVYWKYNAKIYNFVNHILFDAYLAEDITQKCFIKIWERRALIDPNKSLSAYMMVISRNMAYKEMLQKIAKVRIDNESIELFDSLSNTTEEDIDFFFTEQHLESLIELLPTARKKIFKMSRYDGLSNKEIAKNLNLSEKTIETQIYRSLSFLKEKMSGEILALMLFLGL